MSFKLVQDTDLELEFFLTSEDASFHCISTQSNTNIIGLKFSTSGEKHFFWIQSKDVDAAEIVEHMNHLINSLKHAEKEISKDIKMEVHHSNPYEDPMTFLKNFDVEYIDTVLSSDDKIILHELLPPNIPFNEAVTSVYFRQAVDQINGIMNSSSAFDFLSEFQLDKFRKNECDGILALLQALRNKFK